MSGNTGTSRDSRGRLRRTGLLAAALASIALVAAACGDGSSPPVAAGSSNFQRALAYARCMRAASKCVPPG